VDDGRAAVVQGLKAVASGDTFAARVDGRHQILSASGTTFSRGVPVFWDISAHLAIGAALAEDGDYYLGLCAKAKTSGQTRVQVDLNAERQTQRGLFTTRVREIDHADTAEFILLDAVDNPNGMALVAFLGDVSEAPAGSSEDQLIITLFDEDDNAIDTLTTTNTTPDAIGDIIVGAVSMFSSATGAVFKRIPAGKAAYAKVTQATAGTPAGKLKVRAVLMPLA
jgi:hypothetical protein